MIPIQKAGQQWGWPGIRETRNANQILRLGRHGTARDAEPEQTPPRWAIDTMREINGLLSANRWTYHEFSESTVGYNDLVKVIARHAPKLLDDSQDHDTTCALCAAQATIAKMESQSSEWYREITEHRATIVRLGAEIARLRDALIRCEVYLQGIRNGARYEESDLVAVVMKALSAAPSVTA